MKTFIAECHRRRVFRTAALYVVGAWIVLQVADLAFDSWGYPPEVLRHVWLAAILGFPVALVFGWRFDVIGGRIVRTPDAHHDVKPPLQRTDYLILTSVAIIVIVIIVGLASEVSRTRDSQPEQDAVRDVDPRSIAVLPFEDMSENQDQAYFGDGIADELLNRLAKVRGFRVAGRTSSFALKDRNESLRAIGDKLNVAVVLEGSVRKVGDQIRITAQLVDTADGFYLWSQTFDREMKNVFAIQDEIAGSVVAAVQMRLLAGGEPVDLQPAAVANWDAYVLYLKGRHLVYQRSGDSARHEQAQDMFEQAITIDPDYAPAYAGLATALVLGPLDQSIMFPMAEQVLETALALEPENSESLATLGLLRQLQGRPGESRQALERAIAVNPNNAQAHTWLGRSYAIADPARYLAHVRKAYRTDPLDPTALFHLSVAASRSGHYEEAIAAAGERHALDATGEMGFRLAGDVHHQSGQLGKALKTYFHVSLMAPEAPFGPVPRELITLNEYELAEAWVVEMKKARPGFVPLAEPILTLLGGHPQQAFQLYSDFARQGQDASMDLNIAWAHLIFDGDFDAARASYERYLLKQGAAVPRFDATNWLWYADYAVALQRTGAPERAQELIAESMALVEMQLASGVVWAPYFELRLHVWLSALHALSGNKRQAIAELRKAAGQDGVLSCTWCLRHWPHWDNVRDDPGFEALIVEQEAKLTALRQRLAAEDILLTPRQVLELENFSFDPFAQ